MLQDVAQIEPANDGETAKPKRVRRSVSAVTSGRRRFVCGDGNSPWARRRRDLELLFLDDLGGADMLTGFQRELVLRTASLCVELEMYEGRMSLGEDVDLDNYGRAAERFRRFCETLGIERKARDVSNDIVQRIMGRD
jgi:hypothetical protein